MTDERHYLLVAVLRAEQNPGRLQTLDTCRAPALIDLCDTDNLALRIRRLGGVEAKRLADEMTLINLNPEARTAKLREWAKEDG